MRVTVGNAIADEIFDDVLAVSVNALDNLTIEIMGEKSFTRGSGDWYRVFIESDLAEDK